jgi:peptide/nickel transport system permease protein
MRSPRLVIGLLLLGTLALAAICAPLAANWLGHDPFAPDLFKRHAPTSAEHPLGTDELGRDLLLRLLHGARISLAVGIATALAAALLGTAIGLLAAWRGGALDAALMRLADGMLALPALPVLVVLAAADTARIGLPRGEPLADVLRIVAILTLFGWVGVARLARRSSSFTMVRHSRMAMCTWAQRSTSCSRIWS